MSKPFVILFTARSGSTAIYGDLSNHPDVTMRDEVFGNRRLPGEMEQNDDNRVAFLRRYFSPFKIGAVSATPLPAKGFKIQITATNQQFGQPARLAKILNEYGTKVVVLRRRSLVHQYISSQNAMRLKDLTSAGGGLPTAHVKFNEASIISELATKKFAIDIPTLRQGLARLRESYKKLDQIALRFDEPLNIEYEDYLADRTQVLARIAEFIGVDAGKFADKPAYAKITDGDLGNVVANYEALKRFAENNKLSI